MKIMLGIPMIDPVFEEAQSFVKQQFGIEPPTTKPHITLKIPFGVRSNQSDKYKRLEEVALYWASVTTVMRTRIIGYNHFFGNVVFADIEMTPEMEKSFDCLNRAFSNSGFELSKFEKEANDKIAQSAFELTEETIQTVRKYLNF